MERKGERALSIISIPKANNNDENSWLTSVSNGTLEGEQTDTHPQGTGQHLQHMLLILMQRARLMTDEVDS